MNSSCALLAEFHVNLPLYWINYQLSANLHIILIGYRNIGKISYQCITTDVRHVHSLSCSLTAPTHHPLDAQYHLNLSDIRHSGADVIPKGKQ